MAHSVKNFLAMQEIPGSERSPGERNGYPLQYFCLENSMDRGTWWATVHGVARFGQTEQLHYYYYMLLRTHINFTSPSVEIKAGNHNYILKTDPKAGNGKTMVLI